MRRARRRSGLLWPACLIVVAAVVAAVVALEHGRGRTSSAYTRGGAPLRHDAGDALFGDALPGFVIALDHWRRAGGDDGALADARARLDGAAAALPGSVADATGALAGACERAATVGDDELDAAAEEVLGAAGRLNRALAGAGLGYRVEADVLTDDRRERAVLLLTFTVEHVSLFASDGQELRALRVRRLDRLNWSHTMLGFSGDDSEDALVLLDGVEQTAARLSETAGAVTPAALNASDALADEPWWPEWSAAVNRALAHELAGGALERRLVAAVERHEAQHLLDRRAALPVPRALATWVGAGAAAEEHSVAGTAHAELSAYTSGLARGDLPHVELALLASYLLDDGFWGSGECYAALVLANELARALELETPPIVAGRRIQPERAAQRFAALLALSDDELRAAARASWERLFGRPLAPLRALDQAGSQSSP